MTLHSKKIIVVFYFLIVFIFSGCSLYKTAINVSRLQYRLNEVNNVMLCDVPLEGKNKFSDFSAMELLRITGTVAKKKCPVSFILNIDAKNPSDSIGAPGGKAGGYARTDITIKSFPWRLFIDDKETVAGNIANPIYVPGTGEEVVIPVSAEVDLIKFFGEQDYKSLINLAFAIAGSRGYSAKLTLFVKPTISSSFGDFTYPGELKIVEKEFSN
jgi:hypothetical protein